MRQEKKFQFPPRKENENKLRFPLDFPIRLGPNPIYENERY